MPNIQFLNKSSQVYFAFFISQMIIFPYVFQNCKYDISFKQTQITRIRQPKAFKWHFKGITAKLGQQNLRQIAFVQSTLQQQKTTEAQMNAFPQMEPSTACSHLGIKGLHPQRSVESRKSKKDFTKSKQGKKKETKSGLSIHWDTVEQKRYVNFLAKNITYFLLTVEDKKGKKIYGRMSAHVKLRTPAQCRSHHQKMLERYGSIIKLLEEFHQQLSQRSLKQLNAKKAEQRTLAVALAPQISEPTGQTSLLCYDQCLLKEDSWSIFLNKFWSSSSEPEALF